MQELFSIVTNAMLLICCLLQIKSTLVHSCPDLLLHLDFLGVNPSNIKTVIKNSQNIVLEEVTMDNKFKDRQQIKMAFLNIGKTTLRSFGISDAVKVRVYAIIT